MEEIKNFLRFFKLNYLLFVNGFVISGNTLIKGQLSFPLPPDDFKKRYVRTLGILNLYRQYRHLFKMINGKIYFDDLLIEEKNCSLSRNGVNFLFSIEESLFGLPFFLHPNKFLQSDSHGAEFWGYLKYRDIHEADVVFDCGSYQGHFALYAAKKARKGKVYCFEPDEKNISLIKKNLQLNRLTNVFIVKKVLAGHTGKITFFAKGGAGSKISNYKSKSDIEIDCITLADFCTENKINHVNFIKMDVEGAEVQVVESSQNFIRNCCDYLAIASYHKLDENEDTSQYLEKLFKKLGFHSLTAYPLHKTTYGIRTSSS